MKTKQISLYFSALACMALLTPQNAFAADIEASSRIDRVTVFTDRAQITRIVKATVPKGNHRLVLSDLPLAMFQESLRSRGGSGTYELGRVSLAERPFADFVQDRERELVQEIEALSAQSRVRADRIAAQQIKLDFIKKISSTATNRIDDSLQVGEPNPDFWVKGWETLLTGADEALEQIRLAQEDITQLQRRIDKAQRELQQLSTGDRSILEAAIDVQANEDSEVAFELVYQVGNAYWQPQYDAKLNSETSEVTLLQYGAVQQGTGEAWNNVALEFSTTTPGQGSLPELYPWWVDIMEPIAPLAKTESRNFAAGAARQMAEPALADSLEEAAAPVQAVAVTSEFAAIYRVNRRVSVPADRSTHQMLIDRVVHPTTLRAETVPKLQRAAFILAEFEHKGEAPFPSGAMTLFRDGALLGNSRLALLRPGEKRELSFGVDDRIEIDYRLDADQKSDEGIIDSYRRTERRYLIEAVNHHQRPIELTILDQIPVSQDEDIEVEMLDGTTKPTAIDVEDRRGVISWSKSLEAGEQIKIRFGFAVTHPDDVQINGF